MIVLYIVTYYIYIYIILYIYIDNYIIHRILPLIFTYPSFDSDDKPRLPSSCLRMTSSKNCPKSSPGAGSMQRLRFRKHPQILVAFQEHPRNERNGQCGFTLNDCYIAIENGHRNS